MNATVQYYNNALMFTANMLSKYRASNIVDKTEIVHTLWAEEKIPSDNWKKLIINEIKQSIAKPPIVSLDEAFIKKYYEPVCICKKCGTTDYQSQFPKVVIPQKNTTCYLSICKTCYNEKRRGGKPLRVAVDKTTKNRQRNHFDKTNLTDRYIKLLMTRRHKGLIVTKEMIEMHRQKLIQKRMIAQAIQSMPKFDFK